MDVVLDGERLNGPPKDQAKVLVLTSLFIRALQFLTGVMFLHKIGQECSEKYIVSRFKILGT